MANGLDFSSGTFNGEAKTHAQIRVIHARLAAQPPKTEPPRPPTQQPDMKNTYIPGL